jgi:hypothetical protein
MAEVIQAVSAIVACVVYTHDGYQQISNFIRALNEMGHNVAELQQRFREEDCRMWYFAKAQNLVIDENHSIDAVSERLPPFWIETIYTRLSFVENHLEEAKQVLGKYTGASSDADDKAGLDASTASLVSLENIRFIYIRLTKCAVYHC